jgi:hypothetical protein
MLFRHSARLGALLLVGAVGCGLIDPDITKLTFDLPTKKYTFAAPSGVPAQAVPCGPGTPLATCPALPGLTTSCESGVCAASVPFTKAQTMDLRKEVPQLMSVENQSLADITLSQLSYSVTNTTNVTIPEIELYLAPAGVTDPADPSAQKFGRVPAVQAQSNASGNVEKEPGADDLFIMYGHNFGTPFNFIATTTVVIPSGTAPGGMVDVTINGKVSAKLSL